MWSDRHQILQCGVCNVPEDRRWALVRKTVVNGEEKAHPLENRCYECVQLWGCNFFHLDWDSFLEQYHAKEDNPIKAAVDTVNANLDKPAALFGFFPAEVRTSMKTSFEVERQYDCLSARELKRKLGVTKLTKQILGSTPKVQLQSELQPGELEDVYVFKKPGDGGRTGVLRTMFEGAMTEIQLEPGQHMWEQQAPLMFRSTMQAKASSVGTKTVVDRERHMLTLAEFLKKNKKKEKLPSAAGSDVDAAGGCEQESVEEEEQEQEEQTDQEDVEPDEAPLTHLGLTRRPTLQSVAGQSFGPDVRSRGQSSTAGKRLDKLETRSWGSAPAGPVPAAVGDDDCKGTAESVADSAMVFQDEFGDNIAGQHTKGNKKHCRHEQKCCGCLSQNPGSCSVLGALL